MNNEEMKLPLNGSNESQQTPEAKAQDSNTSPQEKMDQSESHVDIAVDEKSSSVPSPPISGDKLKFIVKKKFEKENKQRLILTLKEAEGEEGIDNLLRANRQLDFTVCTRDKWDYEEILEGDTIKVLGQFNSETLECHLEDYKDDIFNGYIILDPETYLSATMISDASDCMRKGFFEFAFPRTGNMPSYPLLLGSMVHEMFDLALVAKENLEAKHHEILEGCLSERITEVHLVEKTEKEAREDMKFYMDNIKQIVDSYFIKKKQVEGTDYKWNEIIAIEQKMFSRRFSIKGQTDVTIKAVNVIDKTEKIAALELKSGEDRDQISHELQASLYALLLQELDCNINEKQFLLYLKDSRIKQFNLRKQDYADIIQMRNRLIKQQQEFNEGKRVIPSRTKNLKNCIFCSRASFCYMYSKVSEEATIEDLSILEQVDKLKQLKEKLSPETYSYFKKWNNLISLEQNFSDHSSGTEYSYKNKKRYFEGEIAEEHYLTLSSITQKEKDVIITLKKSGEIEIDLPPGNYVDIFCTDYPLLIFGRGKVVGKEYLSDEYRQKSTYISLCITETHNYLINVQKIGEEALKKKNWSIRGGVQSFTTFNTMRWAMTSLCTSFTPRNERLRELVISLANPRPPKIEYLSGKLLVEFSEILKNLNAEQIHAIIKILNCQDYQLVMGVPGSGKSTTIAALLEILAKLKKRVLIATSTNLALDNILRKLVPRNIKFIRIAFSKDSVLPEIQPFIASKLQSQYQSYNAYLEFLDDVYIYASTTFGVTTDIMRGMTFSICVIDEAAQMVEPACIAPLLSCDRFAMFGDSIQQNPLVNNPKAKNQGLGITLFQRLSEAHPEFLTKLCKQYIMNQGITQLINKVAYGGIIEFGSDQVCDQKLMMPHRKITGFGWIDKVCNPDCSVALVNTDPAMNNLPASNSEKTVRKNKFECWIVLHLVYELLQQGLDPSSIGIISPCPQQNKALKDVLDSKHIEVFTLEKGQSIVKDCIIISCVKQNNRPDLIKEVSRVNLVFTRARSKLVIVGSKLNLKHINSLRNYFTVIKNSKLDVEVPDIVAEKEYCVEHFGQKELKVLL